MATMNELKELRDYLIKHKKFISVIAKDNILYEKRYWEGYREAMQAFKDKVEELLIRAGIE
jgi:hypothetical protein